MSSTLFIINDAPYGNERAYNALRLAGALAGREDQRVRVFLMADAVGCAKAGQKVPEGYYNVQLMLGKILRKGEVALCGTCMDARGLTDQDMVDGARRWANSPNGPPRRTRCWCFERSNDPGGASVSRQPQRSAPGFKPGHDAVRHRHVHGAGSDSWKRARTR